MGKGKANMIHKCPEEITKLFKQDAAQGRKKAIDWIHSVKLQPGDIVYMPNGETGELECYENGKDWGRTIIH